jgi:hypothetical protein
VTLVFNHAEGVDALADMKIRNMKKLHWSASHK